MELKDTKTLVENLLREYPVLRGNDDLLYLEVLRRVHPYWNNGRITTNIENMPIGEFFSERRNMKLPSFESVRRSRAKIMENIKVVRYCCECKTDLQPGEENVCNWCRRELAAKDKEMREKEEEENED